MEDSDKKQDVNLGEHLGDEIMSDVGEKKAKKRIPCAKLIEGVRPT